MDKHARTVVAAVAHTTPHPTHHHGIHQHLPSLQHTMLSCAVTVVPLQGEDATAVRQDYTQASSCHSLTCYQGRSARAMTIRTGSWLTSPPWPLPSSLHAGVACLCFSQQGCGAASPVRQPGGLVPKAALHQPHSSATQPGQHGAVLASAAAQHRLPILLGGRAGQYQVQVA